MIKFILLVGGAVFLGIWAYNKILQNNAKVPAKGTQYTDSTGSVIFAGPDVDPKTGAYTLASARPGTVEFSAQNN